mgnify:FL=1
MPSNFQHKPKLTGFPDIDEYLFSASTNYRIDNVNYKYYIYLANADGNYISLTTDAIELLNISDNVLDYTAFGSIVFRNDDDAIERTNIVNTLEKKENYFARQRKNYQTMISEFFFRNDCRDYLLVYIQPEIKNLTNDEEIKKLHPFTTLQYKFTVIENEDMTVEDSDIKYKKLTLVDNVLEIFREKNIDFSTANFIQDTTEVADLDDSERQIKTGSVIKELIRSGIREGSMGEDAYVNNESADKVGDSFFSKDWDDGTTDIFYASPGEYNVLDDLDYILERHTSSQKPFDRCLLRKDRFTDKWSLISLQNYFNNAIMQDESSSWGGLLHLETILLGTQSSNYSNADAQVELKSRTPVLPINNETLGDYSFVDKFKFHNMNGLDNQKDIVTTAVHSYQLNDKTFQIDITNNNAKKALQVYYETYVKGADSNQYPLFLANNKDQINSNIFLNAMRKNNINYKNVFSINDKEPDQRLGVGRNAILTCAIFKNNALELDLKGITTRAAGRFLSFNRAKSLPEGKFDDKVFGTYFLVNVEHVFNKGSYVNKVIGVKTYLYSDPFVKEAI